MNILRSFDERDAHFELKMFGSGFVVMALMGGAFALGILQNHLVMLIGLRYLSMPLLFIAGMLIGYAENKSAATAYLMGISFGIYASILIIIIEMMPPNQNFLIDPISWLILMPSWL